MLYDPARGEKDACGLGFVADVEGAPSRAIVDAALEALCRVRHRGALAADTLTGDGAGLLLPIPRVILGSNRADDRVGLGMFFLDVEEAVLARRVVEAACHQEKVRVHHWRPVPVDRGALGSYARASLPAIEQAVLVAPPDVDRDERERRAFRVRRRLASAARSSGIRLYVASLSFETVTYKALCAADQLASFYPDLSDRRLEAWFAIFHQRYSTNTAPTWERAQPFRALAHNGEINTIRGNTSWMRAREGSLGGGELASEELLSPVIDDRGSDSAMLDEALELLVRAGRDVAHALAILVPPAWENDDALDPATRGFFAYHANLMEPWDGPAALMFTDGRRVGAALDRNGLRPLRVSLSDEGILACTSEAGAVPLPSHGRVRRSKLGPGQMIYLDPAAGGVWNDRAIKSHLGRRRPYAAWIAAHENAATVGRPLAAPPPDLRPRQVAAGFTKEEMTVVVRPMAVQGTEPTSSMGDDTAQPPFVDPGRSVFGFLKQRFAQVTNPPIDHLRERHVMSLTTRLGSRPSLLREVAEAAGLRRYRSPLLFPSAVDDLVADGAVRLDATFDPLEGPETLRQACLRLASEASDAVLQGAAYVVVSHAKVDPERAPVPSGLAAGSVHHRLLAHGLRARASIVVDADDVRESHHVACLLTNGTDAVCPRLALGSIVNLVQRGRLGGDLAAPEAQCRYMTALEDGLLKIMSKMGISTVDSYRGAQIMEAIGLDRDVVRVCFNGIASVLKGLSFTELGADVLLRHHDAFRGKLALANPGFVKFRSGGEFHAFNPSVIEALQASVRAETNQSDEERAAHHLRRAVGGNLGSYEAFASTVNGRPPTEPRDLLEPVWAGRPLKVDGVEPAASIVKRFSTGAMSHGALSTEAHETLSIALNMIGAKSNTGEGGEATERFRGERNSAIKQVASARFGVTPEYLAFAEELQIKMAQGSKPGEGGQIPGHKVTAEIARLRHTVPGVPLISPPPHHDIYSIEDLAQLIFDLKQANPRALVSVKLVSSEGVGTIAAGVVKGLADVVHISGGDGGTGASPLSSIKNAGMPWEIGLAETQAALCANGLRSRARVRVDGGIKTGRDVVIAALLGADEYSFGTAALVAEGCILVRTCHRNTCPVGIATQDPVLRQKFAGTPEMVARYLVLVAEEARTLLARLGLSSLDDAIGRVELLGQKRTGDVRADSLSLAPLLEPPDTHERRFAHTTSLRRPRSELGDRVYRDALPALKEGRTIELRYRISNSDRAVGARLGSAAQRETRPSTRGKVRANFEGVAGQSFGAFLSDGIELCLEGEANDYVCKGQGGGRVIIRPPQDDAGDPCLVGNTVLYGATGGQLHVAGRAGERFAVRNSGAVAMIEGAGDHTCEYMTAGAVVILGPVGRNFGAGMSGGEAYVYDPGRELDAKVDPRFVTIMAPTYAQLVSLERMVRRHLVYTGSPAAGDLLNKWAARSENIRRVVPLGQPEQLAALFREDAASAA